MSDHAHRRALALGLVGALVALTGCTLYKSELLDPNGGGGTGAGTSGSGAGRGGSSGAGTGPCVPTPETCNAIDDDCDGQIDDGASESCSSVILHADPICVPFGSGAACVWTECHEGFASCDGEPENGCEDSYCACNPCESDASTDDAGADDGGAQDAGE